MSACLHLGELPATLSIVAPYGEMSRSDRGVTTNCDNHKFAACDTNSQGYSRKTVVIIASGHPSVALRRQLPIRGASRQTTIYKYTKKRLPTNLVFCRLYPFYLKDIYSFLNLSSCSPLISAISIIVSSSLSLSINLNTILRFSSKAPCNLPFAMPFAMPSSNAS